MDRQRYANYIKCLFNNFNSLNERLFVYILKYRTHVGTGHLLVQVWSRPLPRSTTLPCWVFLVIVNNFIALPTTDKVSITEVNHGFYWIMLFFTLNSYKYWMIESPCYANKGNFVIVKQGSIVWKIQIITNFVVTHKCFYSYLKIITVQLIIIYSSIHLWSICYTLKYTFIYIIRTLKFLFPNFYNFSEWQNDGPSQWLFMMTGERQFCSKKNSFATKITIYNLSISSHDEHLVRHMHKYKYCS